MSESGVAKGTASTIERPRCADCDRLMWLCNIKPAEPGFETRTYECSRCAASQTILVRQAAR